MFVLPLEIKNDRWALAKLKFSCRKCLELSHKP